MFYYLSGSVAEIEPGLAVIDCGGVGYACATTNYTLAQLKKGERAKLYTYMNINTNAKDDVVELFGFASQSELKSFKMLINVNGVGPRAALSILSSTTPSSLATSIITEDEKALTAAPGIGKKIAQRIILELKDKLAKEQNVVGFSDIQGVGVAASVTKNKASEASAALSVLGYGSQEIASALRGIDMDKLSLEEIIRQALKQMVR
jgi:Holliday junction DNA helicase RuvA